MPLSSASSLSCSNKLLHISNRSAALCVDIHIHIKKIFNDQPFLLQVYHQNLPCCFWMRNWSHITTHLVVDVVVVGDQSRPSYMPTILKPRALFSNGIRMKFDRNALQVTEYVCSKFYFYMIWYTFNLVFILSVSVSILYCLSLWQINVIHMKSIVCCVCSC